MKRRVLIFAFVAVLSYALAAPFLAITPVESRWFVGFALAFLFAALGRAATLWGLEKRPNKQVIIAKSVSTGIGSLFIVFFGSLLVPQAPQPNDTSFLAGMVALGAGIGMVGAEYFLEPLLERLRKGKAGGNNG